MSTRLRAYLGQPGLTNVGYRLYNADNTPRTARITAGVAEIPALPSWYDATATLPEEWQGYIVWDSPSVPRPSVEELDTRALVVPTTVEALQVLAGIAEGVGGLASRLEAQVPGGGPVLVIPPAVGPSESVCRAITRSARGVAVGGVPVHFTMLSAPGAGAVYKKSTLATSSAQGELSIVLVRGARYRASGANAAGAGAGIEFVAGPGDVFELPSLIVG